MVLIVIVILILIVILIVILIQFMLFLSQETMYTKTFYADDSMKYSSESSYRLYFDLIGGYQTYQMERWIEIIRLAMGIGIGMGMGMS